MGSVIGIDLNAALRLADELGYETGAVAELIEHAEAGMIEAIQESKSDG